MFFNSINLADLTIRGRGKKVRCFWVLDKAFLYCVFLSGSEVSPRATNVERKAITWEENQPAKVMIAIGAESPFAKLFPLSVTLPVRVPPTRDTVAQTNLEVDLLPLKTTPETRTRERSSSSRVLALTLTRETMNRRQNPEEECPIKHDHA